MISIGYACPIKAADDNNNNSDNNNNNNNINNNIAYKVTINPVEYSTF